MKKWMIIIAIFLPHYAWAVFWHGHDKGWHWYEIHDEAPKKASSKNKRQGHAQDPTATIEALHKSSEQTLHQAILEPTEDNVLQYLKIQQRLIDMSANFSSQWQKVMWQHPELDYSVQHPASDVGQQIYAGVQKSKTNQTLQQIQSDYGLFFYFESTCPYCHKMAPTVKAFADYYGFDVLPVTLDGGTLPAFPQAKKDNGSIRSLKVTTVPALFLIHHQTQSIIPVGFGLLSFDEIESRIVKLMGDAEIAVTGEHAYAIN